MLLSRNSVSALIVVHTDWLLLWHPIITLVAMVIARWPRWRLFDLVLVMVIIKHTHRYVMQTVVRTGFDTRR